MAAQLVYEERGAGEAILLLHGHPFDHRMWEPQLAGLAGDFRVIAPDLPGYGSSPVRSGTITMRELADAATELLDELGVETAVVGGLSMGGLVAMELGLAHPERTTGLVLAATTAAPVTPEEAASRRATADELEANGMLTTTLEMAGRLFGPQARKNPELVGAVLAMMIATKPAGAAAALRGRAERPNYAALLAGLEPPALVIAGAHDTYSTDEVIAQLAASLPDPQVVRLADSGHLPNLEEPERFNDAVRAFARG